MIIIIVVFIIISIIINAKDTFNGILLTHFEKLEGTSIKINFKIGTLFLKTNFMPLKKKYPGILLNMFITINNCCGQYMKIKILYSRQGR